MLTREVIGTVLVSLVFLIAGYIFLRVQKRRSSQESTMVKPLDAKDGDLVFPCMYVATVFASRPLERVWAFGLGIRGKAEIRSLPDGLSIYRQGETSFFVPFESLPAVERASATIDRGVERGGLIQIRWWLGNQELITSLRITTNQEENFSRLVTLVQEAR